jgi:NtrC-family two-component system response regulator AlgB
MFRRYARLSARPTGGEPSTGLGLSIVKKLVLAMHGELACESTPGNGATLPSACHALPPALNYLYGLPGHRRRQDIPRRDLLAHRQRRPLRGRRLLGSTGPHGVKGREIRFGSSGSESWAGKGLDILEQILKRQPNLPVVMFTAQGSVKNAVEAMRRGAVDFLEKPFTREQFHLVLARVQRFHQLNQNIERLEREVKDSNAQSPEILLDSSTPLMKEVMDTLLRAAKTPASILILGESGTGKSVVARAVHQKSHLADKPFVTVSCPSLSKELLESELFGHVKGAFTGALRDHWGKVKAAAGGTLFLDEIGDLPMEIQPKLLRLLQEREYERVGENVTRHAEVRIIAATSRISRKRVADGAFREDLFFRLNVITAEMPPLRQRPGDLIRFAGHYFKHFAALCGRRVEGFSEQALAAIRAYSWPGNLRELPSSPIRAWVSAGAETDATHWLERP